MTYQLYRIEHLGAAPTAPPLGAYPDFDTALRARDADVITQLRDAPVPPREIGHLVVGPGARGPRTSHPLIAFAGAEVDDPDPAAEIAATETWLQRLRAT
jgi:hypothetical protein